jgi:hypothetical protein
MSRDVYLRAADTAPPRIADMPTDGHPCDMGPRETLRARLGDIAPQIDWSGPVGGPPNSGGLNAKIDIKGQAGTTDLTQHLGGGPDAGRASFDASPQKVGIKRPVSTRCKPGRRDWPFGKT